MAASRRLPFSNDDPADQRLGDRAARAIAREDLGETAGVVGVLVREHDEVERPDAELQELLGHARRLGTRVDEDGRLAAHEQGRRATAGRSW